MPKVQEGFELLISFERPGFESTSQQCLDAAENSAAIAKDFGQITSWQIVDSNVLESGTTWSRDNTLVLTVPTGVVLGPLTCHYLLKAFIDLGTCYSSRVLPTSPILKDLNPQRQVILRPLLEVEMGLNSSGHPVPIAAVYDMNLMS